MGLGAGTRRWTAQGMSLSFQLLTVVAPPSSIGHGVPGQGVTYNIGKFPYMANSRAKTNGESPHNTAHTDACTHAMPCGTQRTLMHVHTPCLVVHSAH